MIYETPSFPLSEIIRRKDYEVNKKIEEKYALSYLIKLGNLIQQYSLGKHGE